jgi:hypothetical protein
MTISRYSPSVDSQMTSIARIASRPPRKKNECHRRPVQQHEIRPPAACPTAPRSLPDVASEFLLQFLAVDRPFLDLGLELLDALPHLRQVRLGHRVRPVATVTRDVATGQLQALHARIRGAWPRAPVARVLFSSVARVAV